MSLRQPNIMNRKKQAGRVAKMIVPVLAKLFKKVRDFLRNTVVAYLYDHLVVSLPTGKRSLQIRMRIYGGRWTDRRYCFSMRVRFNKMMMIIMRIICNRFAKYLRRIKQLMKINKCKLKDTSNSHSAFVKNIMSGPLSYPDDEPLRRTDHNTNI